MTYSKETGPMPEGKFDISISGVENSTGGKTYYGVGELIAYHRDNNANVIELESFTEAQHFLETDTNSKIPDDFADLLGVSHLRWQLTYDSRCSSILLLGAQPTQEQLEINKALATIHVDYNMASDPGKRIPITIAIAGVANRHAIAARYQKSDKTQLFELVYATTSEKQLPFGKEKLRAKLTNEIFIQSIQSAGVVTQAMLEQTAINRVPHQFIRRRSFDKRPREGTKMDKTLRTIAPGVELPAYLSRAT
jgi:hypothetical protein